PASTTSTGALTRASTTWRGAQRPTSPIRGDTWFILSTKICTFATNKAKRHDQAGTTKRGGAPFPLDGQQIHAPFAPVAGDGLREPVHHVFEMGQRANHRRG